LSTLVDDPELIAWRPLLRHARAQQARLFRDQTFKHPAASAVRGAIAGGPPVNAADLRAIITEELQGLRRELRSTDTMPWKRYWNTGPSGEPLEPRVENECRDHLLDRLRDRLGKYRILAALPEARRGQETRADLLILTGAGRNLPIEIKRHFHPDLWAAASTQLQDYTSDPGADGIGIYLVFWFGAEVQPTPPRSDGGERPTTAMQLEAILIGDLTAELREKTDVVIFDVSNPGGTSHRRLRRRKSRSAGGAC
jgi:hypothetical protein